MLFDVEFDSIYISEFECSNVCGAIEEEGLAMTAVL